MKLKHKDSAQESNVGKILELAEIFDDGTFRVMCTKGCFGNQGVFNRYSEYTVNDDLFNELKDCFTIVTKRYKIIKEQL